MKKRTLAQEVSFSGIGIHTGQRVNLRLKPSLTGQIVFHRLDVGGKAIELNYKLARAESSSLLQNDGLIVRTVEHLLATLYVFGVDSLEIELDGEEIPIGDGSAKPFVDLISQAGQVFLAEEKKIIKIKKPWHVEKDGRWIRFLPAEDLEIFYFIDYAHPLIGHQEYHCLLSLKKFKEEIAPARTFGFLRDVPAMIAKGLAQGGSFDNALILDDQGLINPPLRFPDEFVRHKVLDLLGDLALAGKALLGRIEVCRGGHSLHQAGLASFLEKKDNWEEAEEVPSFLAEGVI